MDEDFVFEDGALLDHNFGDTDVCDQDLDRRNKRNALGDVTDQFIILYERSQQVIGTHALQRSAPHGEARLVLGGAQEQIGLTSKLDCH